MTKKTRKSMRQQNQELAIFAGVYETFLPVLRLYE